MIAHNEGELIGDLLETIKWADEIIVVDCGSTDNTAEVCRKYTNKIFFTENNPNLNVNKAFGISRANSDWIFYIDPDERLTPELTEEIRNVLSSETEFDGYLIPRKSSFLGNYLMRGGNYPDFQLRLFRNGKAEFDCSHVHERIKVDGKVGRLKSDMTHVPYRSIDEYFRKFEFYTDFEKNLFEKNGLKINNANGFKYLVFKPLSKFFSKYILRRGFMDGIRGLAFALFSSFYWIVAYAKYYFSSISKIAE